jgi:hypothetical protein
VALENLAERVAARRGVGPQSRRALHELERGREVAGLQRDHAEHMQRVRMLRLALQYGSIAALRLGEARGSVALERELESLICALLRHDSTRLSPAGAAGLGH